MEDISQRQAKRTTTLGGVPKKRSYAPPIVARKRRRLDAQNLPQWSYWYPCPYLDRNNNNQII
jgi:hypothetical protein